jgi:lysophospholipase L1-like esterase
LIRFIPIAILQCLILVYAILGCFSLRPPRTILGSLALCGLAIVFGGLAFAWQRPRLVQWALPALLICTLILVFTAVLQRHLYAVWTFTNASVIWLVAIAILLLVRQIPDAFLRRRWNAASAGWAFLGAFVWLGSGHVANHRPAFYAGVVIWLMLLVLSKKWFPLPGWGVQLVNTLILLAIGLPLVSLVYAPSEHFDVRPTLAEKPYSYEVARRDPAKFARWSRYNREEGLKFFAAIFFNGKRGLGLVPNTATTNWESKIVINSKGFRGKEIPDAKGDAYRIVALGESTTFGITLEKEDHPWPEILERLIRERLKPSRPVQVINAGIPGWNLSENLQRLPNEIMRLQPDMVLSYHGYNGFQFIYQGMPRIHAKPPAPYRPRPVKLLADVEYQMAIRKYRKEYDLKTEPRPTDVSRPMETEYARLYRQLIAFAATNNIRLALATYSMAVNGQSPGDLIEFYRLTNLGLDWQIKANLAHSAIVRQLAQEERGICLIDTCPWLDGVHNMYYDLVHFTPEGEQQMAELFFSGLRESLEKDLIAKDRASAPQEDLSRIPAR